MVQAVVTTSLVLEDGRKLHVYDTGAESMENALTVFWHHGTPNIGAPPEPLFPIPKKLGVRWVSYDRPGYGGSSPVPDRDVASAAADVAHIADALGVQKFAVMGHSGGGPHALACAALLGERVLGAVSIAGLAPYRAEGLEWFAGVASAASLRAAAAGRAAKEKYEASAEHDSEVDVLTLRDHAALAEAWSWLLEVVNPAVEAGPDALIDDDLAYVAPWGFDPVQIAAPVLLLHGDQDRMVPASHCAWLERRLPRAELRLYPDDGHISVLNHSEEALAWLRERADAR